MTKQQHVYWSEVIRFWLRQKLDSHWNPICIRQTCVHHVKWCFSKTLIDKTLPTKIGDLPRQFLSKFRVSSYFSLKHSVSILFMSKTWGLSSSSGLYISSSYLNTDCRNFKCIKEKTTPIRNWNFNEIITWTLFIRVITNHQKVKTKL